MKFNLKHTSLLFFLSIFLLSCKSTGPISYGKTSITYAQSFEQHLEPDMKLIRSWYHYTVEVAQDKKYVLKMYYPEKKTMTSRHTFMDRKLTILNGKSSYYTDNGDLISEGIFKNNERIGEWKEYSLETGKLQEKGNYIMNEKEGLWTEYDSISAVAATYTYEENKKNGPYQIFKDGKLYESGKFLENDVVNTKMVTAGTKSVFEEKEKELIKLPEFAGCDQDLAEEERRSCAQTKMLQYIYSNIKYPAQARQLGVEGTAIIRFVIEKDGSIDEMNAIKGICAPIEAECLRIVKMMPKWIPGEKEGEAVRVFFNLPVNFKLQ